MQAAEDAARFQHALGLKQINVIRGADAQGSAGSIVVVLDSKTDDIILDGKVKMCIVSAEHTPCYILAALERCTRSKVIVWQGSRSRFQDLADRKLCELTPRDVHALCLFSLKLHHNVEGKQTLRGTWCGLHIGEGSVETSCYTHILGTVVLSKAVEHVLAELQRTLVAEATPLVDDSLPVRGRKRVRFTETTVEHELV